MVCGLSKTTIVGTWRNVVVHAAVVSHWDAVSSAFKFMGALSDRVFTRSAVAKDSFLH